MTTSLTRPDPPGNTLKPILSWRRSVGELVTIRAFVLVPFAALATLGVTVGYHRYFTHGTFKAKRWPRSVPAEAGGLAAQGPVIGWGPNHRRHHADPIRVRHGVPRGQIDVSARLIWLFEKLGRVWQVRWPTPQRLARLAQTRGTAVVGP